MDSNSSNLEYFDQYTLKQELLRGIYSYGYEKPSIIQHKVFTELLSNHDIITLSPSSTGKTASYVIFSLQKVDFSKHSDIQCLVLTSTRDLAQSIGNLYKEIGIYTKVKFHSFIGGTSIKEDIKKLSDGCQIVVGTPGRILDMVNKKILSLSELKLFIIDEVNEVFARGFSDSIKTITSFLQEGCQKSVFSSTKIIPENLDKILKMKNPVIITSCDDDGALLLKNLRQFKISLKEEWKFEILQNLYKLMEISQSIIYCNNKKKCETLSEDMNKKGFISSYINDDKDKVISNFKSGLIRVMITTGEIPAKDIDIYQTSLIINYDIPKTKEEYIERVGRVESFDKRGMVINFVMESDKDLLAEIQKITPENEIDELPLELSTIQNK